MERCRRLRFAAALDRITETAEIRRSDLESGFRSCGSFFGRRCRSRFFDSLGRGFHWGRATAGRLGSATGRFRSAASGFRSTAGGLGSAAARFWSAAVVVMVAEQAEQTGLGLNRHAEHGQGGRHGKQFTTHLQLSQKVIRNAG